MALLGSGHTCTALYEIVPVGAASPVPNATDFKYQKAGSETPAAKTGEWLTVRMRYKNADSEQGKELAQVVPSTGLVKVASDDFRFAASVAAFGMLLRDSENAGSMTFDTVREWASGALGDDRNGLRTEFLGLVQKARFLRR